MCLTHKKCKLYVTITCKNVFLHVSCTISICISKYNFCKVSHLYIKSKPFREKICYAADPRLTTLLSRSNKEWVFTSKQLIQL